MACDGVRVTFVGTGDAFGNGGRNQTCFWLQSTGASVLIDCGATSLTALKAAGAEPNDIDAVLVSHLHGDHFAGIPFLILDGQFRRRRRPLVIAGPPQTKQRVQAAMELFFPGSVSAARRFDITFAELQPGTRTIAGPATVTTTEVEQPGTPACALRVELAGRVIAYTGDTAWRDELIAISDGADLFIAESYFFDRAVPYHLSHGELAPRREQLTARRTILTHMGPGMLERQAEASFQCAHDGLTVIV
jgi:ribonuclease BN (tRNA processing enzyme)